MHSVIPHNLARTAVKLVTRVPIGGTGLILSLVFLAMSYGIVAQSNGLWPSQLFKRAQIGLLILIDETDPRPLLLRHNWVTTVPAESKGVLIHDQETAYPGHTLFTSYHEAGAVLIDMDGSVVHRWQVDDDALKTGLGLTSRFLRELAYAENVKLLPDGSLWLLVRTADTVSNPAGLLRVDRESRVTWTYREAVHHDFDVAEDGSVYVLTAATGTIPSKVSNHLRGFAILDYIDIVDREGRLIRKVSILDAFENSAFRTYLKFSELMPVHDRADVFHANALRLISNEDFSFVPDNGHQHALISMRTPHIIAVIDLDAEEIVRVFRGPWLRQHDPDILPDGTVMLFDNQGRIGSDSISRVIRFDPDNGAILWQWPNGRHRLSSSMRGSQQRLPNGNVLITESQGARLIEVTAEGEIAWEYRSPFRYQDNDQFRFIIRAGQRIGAASWAQ